MDKTLKRLKNYVVYSYEREGIEGVGIKTAEGDWCIEYRFDSPMYSTIRVMLDNDAQLTEFCTLLFITTYMLHGSSVYEAIRDSIVRELSEAGIPQVTKEEDEKMLHDTVEFEMLKEKIYGDGTLQN